MKKTYKIKIVDLDWCLENLQEALREAKKDKSPTEKTYQEQLNLALTLKETMEVSSLEEYFNLLETIAVITDDQFNVFNRGTIVVLNGDDNYYSI